MSESLGGVTVSTLALNARDVDLIPGLGAIFPIFIIPVGGSMTRIQCKLCPVWLLNLPYVYIYVSASPLCMTI